MKRLLAKAVIALWATVIVIALIGAAVETVFGRIMVFCMVMLGSLGWAIYTLEES